MSYAGGFIKKRSLNEQVRKEVPRLARILNLDSNLLEHFIYSNKNPRKLLNQQLKLNSKDKDQILIYLAIEKEISTIILERREKDSLIFNDYGRRLLEPAIERATGDHLSGVDDDFVFENNLEELKRRYTKSYYEVAYKYKLPTLRIVPFIIRLIS
jgi:hypothetical protein